MLWPQGCDTLVTIGGIQSNHTRQVAAVAAKLGLKCRLVQENWVDYHDAVYDRVGNILMSRVMGAHVELVDAGFGINFKESWEKALEDVRREGGKPYAIPAGASDHPLGGLGYVGFAEEVRAQEASLGFKFDYIFVCSVTGSTQAGMVVGFAADGRAARVIGIDASAKGAGERSCGRAPIGEPIRPRLCVYNLAVLSFASAELPRSRFRSGVVDGLLQEPRRFRSHNRRFL